MARASATTRASSTGSSAGSRARCPRSTSPIGRLPRAEDLNLDGLDVSQADLDELFAVDPASWQREADLTEEFYATFGGRVPAALQAELAALRYRLKAAQS